MIACTSPTGTSSERPLRICFPSTETWRSSTFKLPFMLSFPFCVIDLFPVAGDAR